MIDISKLSYFKTSLLKFLFKIGENCPSCNSNESFTLETKFLITSLKRCKNCFLLYRTPTTSVGENKDFYQEEYQQGFTTDCPNDDELKKLIESNFDNHEKNYSKYLKVLNVLNNKKDHKSNLFDYGCSWGYGSFQLKKLFNVVSYEISTPRADYARKKLDINVLNTSELKKIENNKDKFDFFFMSHVLEHLPKPSDTLNFGLNILKKDGYLLSITPNGSLEHKKHNPNWSKLWGMVHPNLIDEKFYQKFFSNKKYYIGSNPFNLNNINNYIINNKNFIDDLSGSELMIIIKNI